MTFIYKKQTLPKDGNGFRFFSSAASAALLLKIHPSNSSLELIFFLRFPFVMVGDCFWSFVFND